MAYECDKCPVCYETLLDLDVNNPLCELPCRHSCCRSCINGLYRVSRKNRGNPGIPLINPNTGVINAIPAGAESDDESEDEGENYARWITSNLFFSSRRFRPREPVRDEDLAWDLGDDSLSHAEPNRPDTLVRQSIEYDVPTYAYDENPLDGLPFKCPLCKTFHPYTDLAEYLDEEKTFQDITDHFKA